MELKRRKEKNENFLKILYKRCTIYADRSAEFDVNINEGNNFTMNLEIQCNTRNCTFKNNHININGFKGKIIVFRGFLIKECFTNSFPSIVETSPNAINSYSLLRFSV